VRGDDIHEAVARRLREVEQRYTPGRRRLVEVLERQAAPVTLPALLAAEPGLPQSTAYRNLAVLEQVGVVTRIVTTGDHASYELAEDLTGHHHHHIVCTGCGTVTDFDLAPALERQLAKVLADAAEAARYEVASHRLDLVGRCAGCR
jgi:Fur family transcriptional regulator, ferric uptake regulator